MKTKIVATLRYPEPSSTDLHFTGSRYCAKELPGEEGNGASAGADGAVCGVRVGVVVCGAFQAIDGVFGGMTKLGRYRCSRHPAVVPAKAKPGRPAKEQP